MKETGMEDNENSRGEEEQLQEEGSPTGSSGSSDSSSLRNIVTTGIDHPGKHDVMFGRGGDTNYHIGNHGFRTMADQYVESYREASRKDKAVIVQQLVDSWRDQTPPGRFLAKSDPGKGENSQWHDVGTEMAIKKASKILTEIASTTAKGSRKRQARVDSASSPDIDDYSSRQRTQQQQPQLKSPPPEQQYTYQQVASHQPYPPVASLPRAQLPAASLPQAQFQMPPPMAGFPMGGSGPLSVDPQMPAGAYMGRVTRPRAYATQQQIPMPQQQVASHHPLQPPQLPSQLPWQPTATPLPHIGTGLHLGGVPDAPSPEAGDSPDRRGNLKEDDSPPAEAKSELQGSDESPPIDAAAAAVAPTAASLSGVFNSSSGSEEKQNGDSSSSSERHVGNGSSPDSKIL
ncbi:expressed unknown protein [Seminavis robusta]|uniref:DUF6824 domain-containing protein n=1 Tax=Seminavis robusta TaxID=568900 RepID=A0A9N8EBN7_9STRA|nr:expressed unknown protein [Seminavis robusta]|eukprot:Sro933_g221740.1 n/a (402) ;mRNA; f:8946-10505